MPEDMFLVDIDQGQISQVIQNLIMNAQQAMPEGGQISVTCCNIENYQGPLAKTDRDYVEIVIKDTGSGIPEEILDKIFDPYFTTKEKGNGLGLSICHSIIRNHEAHIGVQSEIGKGTSFQIFLPASKDQEVERLPEQWEMEINDSARILVMDDEEAVREILSRMLSNLNYEVVLTEDGAEAIARYKEAMDSGEPFDLVIMDLTIPGGMGGKESIQHVLEIDSNAKVIVASGYSNDPVMAHYPEYGFVGTINKPFQVGELQRLVQGVLALRQI
jgi:CheY-like chemotaxis protein